MPCREEDFGRNEGARADGERCPLNCPEVGTVIALPRRGGL